MQSDVLYGRKHSFYSRIFCADLYFYVSYGQIDPLQRLTADPDLGCVVLSHDAADVVGGLDKQTRVAHLLLVRVPWIKIFS